MDGTDLSRVKKKELLATVDLLIKANASAMEIIEKGQAGIERLLATGQELAITLGGKIEARECDSADDAGSEIVHTLEEYCETLYQLSVSGGDRQRCRKLGKLMNKQLLSARQGIQYRLPDDKREIAFFPYKASMWDSLESFWLEAREREDCEAYVVPIPYYDKNPDGSIRQWHYEGNEYPDYVPITPWEQYDLEIRKPDEAYIHNPYDEFNLVTSVHPNFYLSELKKHVGKLIYTQY